jgi:Gpi18-like mannosyltransferase
MDRGKSFLSHDCKYLNKGENAVSFSFAKREVIFLAIMLAIAFVVRVLLFPLQGYQNDMATFSYWFNTAAEHGIRPFYTVVLRDVGWIDYPPFNVYIFWVFGSLAKAVSAWGISTVSIVKLVPNLFDLGTATLIYIFVRKQLNFKQSYLATGLYVFNPAIIFNAAIWGQFDAIYTFFLILSLILALKSKPKLSAAVFAIAILTKPQGIALLPLVIFLIYKKTKLKPVNDTPSHLIQNSQNTKLLSFKDIIIRELPKTRNLLISVAVFAVTVFAVILLFEWTNPVTFLSTIYFGAYSNYQYTSINAFNLWGLFGLWIPDGNLSILGWAMFGAFATFTLYVLHKRFHVSGEFLALFTAFMLFFAFFMLPTRIHERYLFPAISILALMFPLIKKARMFYFVLTGTLLVNEVYVLHYLNRDTFIPSGDLVVIAVSVINLIMFLYGLVLMWDELKGRQWLKTITTTLNQTQDSGERK